MESGLRRRDECCSSKTWPDLASLPLAAALRSAYTARHGTVREGARETRRVAVLLYCLVVLAAGPRARGARSLLGCICARRAKRRDRKLRKQNGLMMHDTNAGHLNKRVGELIQRRCDRRHCNILQYCMHRRHRSHYGGRGGLHEFVKYHVFKL